MWKACGRQELLCETGASSGGAGGARAETPPCVIGAKPRTRARNPGQGGTLARSALVKGAPLHPGELNSCPGPPEHTPLSLGVVMTRRADIQGTTGIF